MKRRLSEWLHAPVEAQVEQRLPHPADKLYHILIDFQEHHLRISPYTLITSTYRVIEGGVGEGTVVMLGSRLTRGETLTYRVMLMPEERSFEFRSDDGRIVHGFQVVPDGADAARVILTVRSTMFSGWTQVPERVITRIQEIRLMHEKLEHLDRYAATFGSRVLHADTPGERDGAFT